MRFTVQWSSAEGEAEAGGSERAVKSEKSAKNCEIFASKDRRYLTGSASERERVSEQLGELLASFPGEPAWLPVCFRAECAR